jgi:hypothetical protein
MYGLAFIEFSGIQVLQSKLIYYFLCTPLYATCLANLLYLVAIVLFKEAFVPSLLVYRLALQCGYSP